MMKLLDKTGTGTCLTDKDCHRCPERRHWTLRIKPHCQAQPGFRLCELKGRHIHFYSRRFLRANRQIIFMKCCHPRSLSPKWSLGSWGTRRGPHQSIGTST